MYARSLLHCITQNFISIRSSHCHMYPTKPRQGGEPPPGSMPGCRWPRTLHRCSGAMGRWGCRLCRRVVESTVRCTPQTGSDRVRQGQTRSDRAWGPTCSIDVSLESLWLIRHAFLCCPSTRTNDPQVLTKSASSNQTGHAWPCASIKRLPAQATECTVYPTPPCYPFSCATPSLGPFSERAIRLSINLTQSGRTPLLAFLPPLQAGRHLGTWTGRWDAHM